MPRRSGQRRLKFGRNDGQHKDDPPDEQTPLEEPWAHEAKRAKRQQRTREALEVTLDVVQEIYNWWR